MPQKKFKGYKYGTDTFRMDNVKLMLSTDVGLENTGDLKIAFMNKGYRNLHIIAKNSLHYFLEVTRQVTQQWWINRLTHNDKRESIYTSIRFRFPEISSIWDEPSYIYGGVSPRYWPSLFCAEQIESLNSSCWKNISKHLNKTEVFDPVEALRLDVKSFVAQRSFNIAIFTLAQAFEITTKKNFTKDIQ